MPYEEILKVFTPGLKQGDDEIILDMPTVGLGTWKADPGEVRAAVEQAIKDGYRHIDTATAYGNEAEVGQGIKDSGVPREKLWVTTKLNNPDMGNPEAALAYSLKQLDCGYLDLWLMHWPAPMTREGGADKSIDWLDTWKTMEKIYLGPENADRQKIKAIGISNFSIKFLNRLLPEAKVVPAINQIELHPWCMQQELVDFCLSKNIKLTSYSPLGSGQAELLKDPVVEKIVAKYPGSNAGNVLISLEANRKGVSVLPKSVTPARIKANFKILDLKDEEIAELAALNKNKQWRVCHPNWSGWGSIGFPDCE